MINQWYPMQEQIGGQPAKTLPVFEDSESELSVDVLVFGYLYDKGGEESNAACWALGYASRAGEWFFHTVNGVYPDRLMENPITTFVPLKWAYLPDEPAEIPSVNDNDRTADIAPHTKALNRADAIASSYTPRPLGEIGH